MTHDLITDEEGLKPGLLSIFATVDVITRSEVESILKENK